MDDETKKMAVDAIALGRLLGECFEKQWDKEFKELDPNGNATLGELLRKLRADGKIDY